MRIFAVVVLLAFAARLSGAEPELEIRIIYDNTAANQELTADWGFAALVTYRGQQILFDTGTKADVFVENARKLGIDWSHVSQALISHAHGDHTGGIPRLARLNPKLVVHYLDRFPDVAYESARRVGLNPRRVTGPFELTPGIYSTGFIDGVAPEQSLLIETARGLVIVTGCSHPGIVKIVETAEKQRGKDSVRLLIGGFHMLQDSPAAVAATVTRLQQLKVNSIMPTHCTGDAAIAKFRESYGAKYEAAGAGKRIVLD